MRREHNLTIPNLLTISRILLTPGFVIAFLDERFDLAWVLFAVAGLTDALDGILARVLKQRSRLGSILDPLADKLLLVTSFICLAVNGWAPRWLVVLVVSRDVIIVGGLTLIQLFGVDVRSRINPSWLSKTTTCVQISLVLFVMVQKSFKLDLSPGGAVLVYLTAVLTLVSLLHYIHTGFRLLPHGDESE